MCFRLFKPALFAASLQILLISAAFANTSPAESNPESSSNSGLPGRVMLSPIHVDPSLTEVNRKGPAVVHQPYQVKDPNTGGGSEKNAKPINRNSQLTFPNGKKVKAGEYFDQLNAFENHVNQYGYSLRTKGESKVDFSHIVLNHSEFTQKVRETQTKHDSTKIRLRVPVETAKTNHEADAAQRPELLKELDQNLHPAGSSQPQPRPYHGSKSWSDTWGWSNKVGAFVDTNVTLDGSSDETSAKGEGSAGGFLFGQQLKIVRAETSFKSPKTGSLTGDVAFYFLGYKIFSKDYDNPNPYFYNNEWSKGLDEGTTIYFSLGPIPMSAKLGAQGDATMDFRMGMLALRANTDFVPGVNSKVYIQVGVDLVVGGAGGGSDLVLINDSLSVEGSLDLMLDSSGPYYTAVLAADDSLTALAGRIYAYVFLYVPRWGLPPWEKKEWDWTLFQEKGVQAKGSIFSFNDKQYLF